MTCKELSQLYFLTREIKMDEQRLAELKGKIQPGTQIVTGMPHANGTTDKTGKLAAEIVDLQRLIEVKRKQCVDELNRLEQYIFNVDDSIVRQILTYRYFYGLRWKQVAYKMGGGYTAESVRQIARRFLSDR